MRILHICNDYCGSKVHSMLYRELDALGVEQTVYVPMRRKKDEGKNRFDGRFCNFVYRYVVKPYHRFLFHLKVSAIVNDIEQAVEVGRNDVIHATTMFSDGLVAHRLSQKYGIPYVVAVRNTDVNTFLGCLPHTWPSGCKVLKNTERVFFMSKALQDRFCQHGAIRNILPQIESRFVFLPNGVEDSFLDNIRIERKVNHIILYIGDFSENKNVDRLCHAVMLLRETGRIEDVELTLVGGGKNKAGKVERFVSRHPEAFHYLGAIHDRDALIKIMREHTMFAMPSIHETFGLVYIEALSQGLPLLYTLGQGVDGLVPTTAGVGVNPFSVSEIADGLEKLLEGGAYYSNKGVDFESYRWKGIAKRYEAMYEEVCQ